MMTNEEAKVGIAKQALCGLKSPLGAIAEFLVGSASVCWCCSFWRGFVYGIVFALMIGTPLLILFMNG